MNVSSRQLSHDPKNAITGSEIAPSSASAVNSVFLRDEKVSSFLIFFLIKYKAGSLRMPILQGFLRKEHAGRV
jgi:hypothetical protein